jgi:L-seryl-tRNA(Ser) seleniumtransferase
MPHSLTSARRLSRRALLGSSPLIAGMLAEASAVPAAAAPIAEPSADVYTKMGGKPFINCTATLTINGGSRQLPEVIAAIEAAGHYHVNLDQLQEAAGKRLSEMLQVPWALVSSGAAGALAYATAAIVAGTDPERITQLPDLTGLKNEVIIPASSRNQYDHAVRMVGLKTIEVETAEELEAAIGHNTALIMVLGNRFDKVELGLAEVAPIAKKHGVPVLVDAAADYLVVPNPYLALGADLVAYSGGKITRGPQTAGLLVGREDLVRAAYWNAAPHHGFCRPMKVSKEEIVGMVAAVETFVKQRDLEKEYAEWNGWYDHITKAVTAIPGVTTKIGKPSRGGPFPTLNISWDQSKIGLTADELHETLINGDPAIQTHASGDGGSFVLRPVAMKPGEYKIVADRLAQIFRSAPKAKPKSEKKAPAGDISGRWDVTVEFTRGSANHLLFLETSGASVAGTHVGTVKRGAVKGSVHGDQVELSSSLKFEGARLGYKFTGALKGDVIEGTLDLDEYPAAKFTARRHGYGAALPSDPTKSGKA